MQNRSWQKTGFPSLRMTVNISPYRFRRKGLVEVVDKILKETGLPPDYLELDIPGENLVGTGKESYNATLQGLSALGVHIALADYGSGNPFISSVQRLPLDVMKIDQSFVHNASVDRDHAAIVQAIVAVARALKLKIVAEGVETKEQLELLRNYGCDMVQGFLFSKAVSSEELTQLLQEGRRFT
jgi:EAL domain-containing protein (putative c-di-GMP-specific phosphodiesterase class I)